MKPEECTIHQWEKSTLGDAILPQIKKFISTNYNPEDIFIEDDLRRWALSHGYVNEDKHREQMQATTHQMFFLKKLLEGRMEEVLVWLEEQGDWGGFDLDTTHGGIASRYFSSIP